MSTPEEAPVPSLWSMLGLTLLTLIPPLPVSLAIRLATGGRTVGPSGHLATLTTFLIGVITIGLWGMRHLEVPDPWQPPRPRRTWAWAALLWPAPLLSLLALALLFPNLPGQPETNEPLLTTACGVALFVGLAPLAEEVFFRGYLCVGLSRRLGPRWGLFLSSLAFGLMHGHPRQALSAFLGGLVLGHILQRGSSLLPCIALHALQNLLVTWLQATESGWMLAFPAAAILGGAIVLWQLRGRPEAEPPAIHPMPRRPALPCTQVRPTRPR